MERSLFGMRRSRLTYGRCPGIAHAGTRDGNWAARPGRRIGREARGPTARCCPAPTSIAATDVGTARHERQGWKAGEAEERTTVVANKREHNKAARKGSARGRRFKFATSSVQWASPYRHPG